MGFEGFNFECCCNTGPGPLDWWINQPHGGRYSSGRRFARTAMHNPEEFARNGYEVEPLDGYAWAEHRIFRWTAACRLNEIGAIEENFPKTKDDFETRLSSLDPEPLSAHGQNYSTALVAGWTIHQGDFECNQESGASPFCCLPTEPTDCIASFDADTADMLVVWDWNTSGGYGTSGTDDPLLKRCYALFRFVDVDNWLASRLTPNGKIEISRCVSGTRTVLYTSSVLTGYGTTWVRCVGTSVEVGRGLTSSAPITTLTISNHSTATRCGVLSQSGIGFGGRMNVVTTERSTGAVWYATFSQAAGDPHTQLWEHDITSETTPLLRTSTSKVAGDQQIALPGDFNANPSVTAAVTWYSGSGELCDLTPNDLQLSGTWKWAESSGITTIAPRQLTRTEVLLLDGKPYEYSRHDWPTCVGLRLVVDSTTQTVDINTPLPAEIHTPLTLGTWLDWTSYEQRFFIDNEAWINPGRQQIVIAVVDVGNVPAITVEHVVYEVSVASVLTKTRVYSEKWELRQRISSTGISGFGFEREYVTLLDASEVITETATPSFSASQVLPQPVAIDSYDPDNAVVTVLDSVSEWRLFEVRGGTEAELLPGDAPFTTGVPAARCALDGFGVMWVTAVCDTERHIFKDGTSHNTLQTGTMVGLSDRYIYCWDTGLSRQNLESGDITVCEGAAPLDIIPDTSRGALKDARPTPELGLMVEMQPISSQPNLSSMLFLLDTFDCIRRSDLLGLAPDEY